MAVKAEKQIEKTEAAFKREFIEKCCNAKINIRSAMNLL